MNGAGARGREEGREEGGKDDPYSEDFCEKEYYNHERYSGAKSHARNFCPGKAADKKEITIGLVLIVLIVLIGCFRCFRCFKRFNGKNRSNIS